MRIAPLLMLLMPLVVGSGCSRPARNTSAPTTPANAGEKHKAAGEPASTTASAEGCRVLLDLRGDKVVDVRLAPRFRVAAGDGTVLRQGRSTWKVWRVKRRRSAEVQWEDLMASKLPDGRPQVLRAFGPGDFMDEPGSYAVTLEIVSALGDLLGIAVSSPLLTKRTEGDQSPLYTMAALPGAPRGSLLTRADKVALKKAFRRAKRAVDCGDKPVPGLDVDPLKVCGDAVESVDELLSINLDQPAPATFALVISRTRERKKDELVFPAKPSPAAFVFEHRAAVVVLGAPSPRLAPFVPRPGTTKVFSPDGCGAVDLASNEAVYPDGHRRGLGLKQKVVGVVWIPPNDPFDVRMLGEKPSKAAATPDPAAATPDPAAATPDPAATPRNSRPP